MSSRAPSISFQSRSEGLFHRCLLGSAAVGIALRLAILLAPVAHQAARALEVEPVRLVHMVTGAAPVTAAPDAPPGTRGPGNDVNARPGPRGGQGGIGGASGPKVRDPRPAGGGAGSAPGPAGAGEAGRARAEHATASLAGTRRALSSALAGLSSSLGTTSSSGAASAPRAPARVSGGRTESQIGALSGSAAGHAAVGNLGGSAVQGTSVAIGSLTGYGGGGGGIGGGSGGGVGSGVGDGTGAGGGDGGSGNGWGGGQGDGTGSGGGSGGGTGSGGGGGGGGGGRGAAPGVYRSNASLMAVVQKYAAGIQFCYGNELRRHPGLRGKLVVALTVNAPGEVTEVLVVQNTLGLPSLTACGLSQIREWRFPAIAAGVTTFQVPFVFTPPN